MDKFILKLYVAGRTPPSQRAVANLRRLCDEELRDCELVIIDVLEWPQLAEGAKIMATPTLVKEQPAPPRRIIGDLSDTRRLLLELDLPTAAGPANGSRGGPPTSEVH